MNYLIDTHILLWWLSDDPQLSKKAREIISNPNNTFFVSSATAWEIGIKKSLGKLKTPDNLEKAIEDNGFFPLSITIPHGLSVSKLPKHHNDPFDKMLIIQSKMENLMLLTHDKVFKKYKTKTCLV